MGRAKMIQAPPVTPFIILKGEEWIKNYILWELKLFSLLGYNLELEKIVTKIVKNENIFYKK